MYVQPDSVIFLYKNVPLTPDYKYTVRFSTKAAQTTYFTQTLSPTYAGTNQSYQRVERGVFRCGYNAEQLYGINYMAFQNTAFGNKWFYAFVTGVEYVSNQSSNVMFTIDEFQTWIFDYKLKECFVEREMPASDTLFANTLPESVNLGEYVFGATIAVNLSSLAFCVQESGNPENPISTSIINNIPVAITNLVYFDPNSVLQHITNMDNPERLFDVFAFPEKLYGDDIVKDDYHIAQPLALGSYVPKNKKLLSYPYSFIQVTNYAGQTAEYRFEDFSTTDSPTFTLMGQSVPVPECMLVPKNHRGKPYDYDNGISNDVKIQCPYQGDAYKSYIEQHQGAIVTSIIASAIASISSQNPLPLVMGAMNTVANMQDLKDVPPQVHGQFSGKAIKAQQGTLGYGISHIHIKEEYAKIIDDFFSMYGYTTNKVKVPNTHSRPIWNYVKTRDMIISGNLPADSKKIIQDAFNAGITFWHNPANVGNYNLDNRG